MREFVPETRTNVRERVQPGGRRMTRNMCDEAAFFDGYSLLNRSIHRLDGAPEWPAVCALLPDMRTLKVLDPGCGYGRFCRCAALQGAADGLGVDARRKCSRARRRLMRTHRCRSA